MKRDPSRPGEGRGLIYELIPQNPPKGQYCCDCGKIATNQMILCINRSEIHARITYIVCNSCFDKHYAQCTKCGYYFDTRMESMLCDENGQKICKQCSNEGSDDCHE